MNCWFLSLVHWSLKQVTAIFLWLKWAYLRHCGDVRYPTRGRSIDFPWRPYRLHFGLFFLVSFLGKASNQQVLLFYCKAVELLNQLLREFELWSERRRLPKNRILSGSCGPIAPFAARLQGRNQTSSVPRISSYLKLLGSRIKYSAQHTVWTFYVKPKKA